MKWLWSVMLLGFLSLSFAANAQTFPNRPVKIIVPYAAGGTADTLARKIGQYLSGYLGQPVIIENRAGAAGIIGAAALQQSASGRLHAGHVGNTSCCNPGRRGHATSIRPN